MNKKYNLKKSMFENMLCEMYPIENLSSRKHKETQGYDDWGYPITKNLTLYYLNNGHIGTWCQGGKCWIF